MNHAPSGKDINKTSSYNFSEPSCVHLPSGEFLMGSHEGQDEEKPIHRVRVSAFDMGIYPVRNREFSFFLSSTGHPPPPSWADSNFNHPDRPVVAVSWFDANEYCCWLSSLTGRSYHLPFEAQWEWAIRAGREGFRYSWGNEPPEQWPDYVHRWGGKVRGPSTVGSGPPNSFKLYDIGENVHEWCADWFSKDYYAQSSVCDPQGPTAGERRASRGGSWRHQIKVSRCAARSSIPPTFQYSDYGFRVVRDARLD